MHNEYDELKQRLLLLEESFAQEKQKLIKDYEDKITSLMTKCVQENETVINELRKKINSYEFEIAGLKSTLEIKENHMETQIQLHQASAAIQIDEAEIKWKTVLDKANEKLTESNNTCINLRNEIITLRNAALYKEEINRHMQEKKELEDKLLCTQNELSAAQEKLLQNQHLTVKKYTGSKRRYNNPRNSTYEVKENTGNISAEHIDYPSDSNNLKTSTASVTDEHLCPSQGKNMSYENLHAVQGLYKTKHNVRMLPLQPCSESKVNIGSRKRKLFNPDNLNFLKEMENQD